MYRGSLGLDLSQSNEQTQRPVLFELEVTDTDPKTVLGLQQMMVLKLRMGKDGKRRLARRGRKG